MIIILGEECSSLGVLHVLKVTVITITSLCGDCWVQISCSGANGRALLTNYDVLEDVGIVVRSSTHRDLLS